MANKDELLIENATFRDIIKDRDKALETMKMGNTAKTAHAVAQYKGSEAELRLGKARLEAQVRHSSDASLVEFLEIGGFELRAPSDFTAEEWALEMELQRDKAIAHLDQTISRQIFKKAEALELAAKAVAELKEELNKHTNTTSPAPDSKHFVAPACAQNWKGPKHPPVERMASIADEIPGTSRTIEDLRAAEPDFSEVESCPGMATVTDGVEAVRWDKDWEQILAPENSAKEFKSGPPTQEEHQRIGCWCIRGKVSIDSSDGPWTCSKHGDLDRREVTFTGEKGYSCPLCSVELCPAWPRRVGYKANPPINPAPPFINDSQAAGAIMAFWGKHREECRGNHPIVKRGDGDTFIVTCSGCGTEIKVSGKEAAAASAVR